ncbi:MAG: nucleoside triphosphate pyrophosphohydrolase [Bacteroidales bacterium]|nr:nucleoside triphosphate pyrophosphohydrolase [Bacteroidales bacterium]
MHTRESQMQAFGRLLDILEELRQKCPWDKIQTNESLRPLTIEETYELSEALLHQDHVEISKELGDLLLHIIFYAKIGSEQSRFDIQDVCEQLMQKLIYRHPHIFGEIEVSGAKEVEQNWEKLKLKEKGGNRTVLAGVPETLPSMIKAFRMQDKARGMGFDWDQKEQVWDKVQEEFSELMAEIDSMEKDKMEAEFGDLFFSLINAARLYNINPDNALERTNTKFRNRFNYLEDKTLLQGKSLRSMSLAEMDVIWNEAKSKGL